LGAPANKEWERDLKLMSKKLGRLLRPIARVLSGVSNPFSWLKIPAKTVTYSALPHKMLRHSQQVVYQDPISALPYLPSTFKPGQHLALAPTFILDLPGGITSSLGASLTAKGELIAEVAENFVIENPSDHPLFHFKWKRLWQRITPFEGSVVSLTAECHDNYYHWLLDVLPRLHLLEQAGYRPDKIYTPLSRPFHKETLERLGYGPQLWIDSDKYPFISAQKLLVPSFPLYWQGRSVVLPPWAGKWVHKNLSPFLKPPTKKRLYISRRDATYRFVRNENEVVAYLEKKGFETVTLSGLRSEEQARLFASAETIVAPHGAGLTNLVFCEKGTRVVEAFYPDFPCACYWHLSQAAGLKYACILGPPREEVPAKRPYADMDIDVALLQRALEALGVE
jgi:hypothetical protein